MEFAAPAAQRIVFDVSGFLERAVEVADGCAVYELDTNLLRAGDYTVRARVMRDGAAAETVLFPLTISKVHDGERMPVWRWGGGGSDPEWWGKRGFTGAFLSAIRAPLGEGSASGTERFLERAARYDFELGFYFYPMGAPALLESPENLSLLPNGERAEGKPYPLEPAVLALAREMADSWTARFHDYPGLRHVMLSSEWQTPMSVNETAVTMAREEIGLDLLEYAKNKWAVVSEEGKKNVQDGIIEDDNPWYRFMQWWWQRGHGTAVLNGMQNEIVKKHNPDLITWHEPYRLAPVRGSHAGLDCIATWTYGHPDIKRLCYTTYLQAAARPEQQLVQQDITLFVYARYAVPLGESTADLFADFTGKDPYFTAGPDFAREGLWLVVSQRPDILCFYSAGKLSPDNPTNDPFYTSPETFDAIGQTCDELVKPYGPAILASRRVAPRVAVLMSAASTWFSASPRLPGYPTEQTLPYATLLMMNHVPFDVLLDEDIVEGALERYDVLVMPRADTLTRTMFERISAFSQSGKKVIADKALRAKVPNAVITDYDFTHQLRIDGKALAKGEAVTAEEDRAIMEQYAKDLAPLLSDVPRPADSDSLRVLTNSLEGGQARYHFFVNDDRTYGPRFGQWKLHFEAGVPQSARMSVALDGRPALYDALRREPIEYDTEDGRAVFTLRLAGARGKLIAALPEPVGDVVVEAPQEVQAGDPVNVTVRVMGASGGVLPCVLPLRIDIVDTLGRNTEWSRFTTARDGTRAYAFIPALNDALGVWTVRVTDLVAGKVGEAKVQVKNP